MSISLAIKCKLLRKAQGWLAPASPRDLQHKTQYLAAADPFSFCLACLSSLAKLLGSQSMRSCRLSLKGLYQHNPFELRHSSSFEFQVRIHLGRQQDLSTDGENPESVYTPGFHFLSFSHLVLPLIL